MNLTEPTYYDIALLHTYFLLAINDDIYQEIHQLYTQNEATYKKRIRELEKVSNNYFLDRLPVDLKWRTLEVVSVLERSTDEEEKVILFKYVKKGYKRLYDYAQTNPKLNYTRAMTFIKERYRGLPEAVLQCLTSLYYVCLPEHPPLATLDKLDRIFIENNMIDAISSASQVLQITEEEKEQALKLFTLLTNKKWRGTDKLYLDEVFGEIERHTINQNPKIKKQIQITGFLTPSYSVAPLKYVRFGQSVFQMLGMDNLMMYTKLFIKKEEWCHLYFIVKKNQELKGFDEEDLTMMMCYALLFFAQHKLYQDLAEQYNDQMYSININEINQARELFEEEQKNAVKEQEEKVSIYTTQIAQLSDVVQTLKEENERLEKEVKRLQQEIVKQQSKAELSERLLDTIFNETSQEILEEREVALPEKVVYVGGHPSLQKQLKEQFSNWYFIAVDDLQRGEQQVKQADLVIFNSHYNNHAQFERLKDLLLPQCVLFAKYGSNIQLHVQDIQMQYRQIQQKLGV